MSMQNLGASNGRSFLFAKHEMNRIDADFVNVLVESELSKGAAMAYNNANMYSRDHLKPTEEDSRTTQALHGSDFLEACNDVSYPALMKILDEHMGAIRIVYPQEYESVLSKIKAL